MILFPNAKINIGLTVGEKREDGFHNISGTFYPVALCDIMEILPAEEFHFQSSGFEVSDQYNLVIEAFRLMQRHYDIPNVFIHLHKQIPLGAGLGGGSADASFCLMGLNELFELDLSQEALTQHALELGSDCPFFIYNKPADVKGRGEIIELIEPKYSDCWVKIVYPDIHISTKEAFDNLDRDRDHGRSELDTINDFENWAFRAYPELEKILHHLQNEGAIIANMTGSGSAMFGIYKEEPKKSTAYEFEKIYRLEQP